MYQYTLLFYSDRRLEKGNNTSVQRDADSRPQTGWCPFTNYNGGDGLYKNNAKWSTEPLVT